MQLSICATILNRYPLLELALDSWVKSAAASGLEWEFVLADWGSGDLELGGLPEWTRVVELRGDFSLGKGRNVAVGEARGEVVAVLDVDMLVPEWFFGLMYGVAKEGAACFPQYLRERLRGGYDIGNGWGNTILLRELALATKWPEKTTWGGEDANFAHKLKVTGCELWREFIPGFIHQYHDKLASSWYGQGREDDKG